MGQQQYKASEGNKEEAVGGAVKHELKDRVGAKFQEPHAVNSAYGSGGSGKQGNPGKPV
jgi:hypothetical protein